MEQVGLPSKENDSRLFLTLREQKPSGNWLTTVFTEETITNDSKAAVLQETPQGQQTEHLHLFSAGMNRGQSLRKRVWLFREEAQLGL